MSTIDKISNFLNESEQKPDRIKEVFTKDKEGNRKSLGDTHTRIAKNHEENHHHYMKGHNDGILAHHFGRTIDDKTASHEAVQNGIYGVRDRKKYVKGWLSGASHAKNHDSLGKKPVYLEKNYDLHENMTSMDPSRKRIDHNEYPKKLMNKSDSELRYIIKDAKEAVAAMPNGKNVGYYLDEINYCSNELYRRQRNKR